MPLAEATALAGYAEAGVPHLELHDPAADRLALVALAEWCQRFSPSVGLEEGEQPEALLLDISGLGPLFGDEQALARHVAQALALRQLVARVAIADTLGAAWAVARYADLEVTHAAGGAFCFAPLVVPPGETAAALAPLSAAALRLPAETCRTIGRARLAADRASGGPVALDTIGPLWAGAAGTTRPGHRPSARSDRRPGPAPEDEFQWLFEHPTGRREMIDAALAELIARACAALAERRHGVLRVRCRFETEQRQAEEFIVGLYRPSAQPRHVVELARLKLEAVRFDEPVAALRLTVLAADRLEYRQQEIFPDERAGRAAPRNWRRWSIG